MSLDQRAVVVAYEDQYCEELHRLVKRLRADQGLPGLILEARSVRGDGGFVKEVRQLLRLPLKQTKRRPELVVCVADADRPKSLAPAASGAPAGDDRAALDRWVHEIEVAWRLRLTSEALLADEGAERLRTVCLRWSKESLLLASPAALIDYAGRHQRGGEVRELLEACAPRPTSLPDEAFLPSYRRPNACMDKIFHAVEGRNYKKGRDDEDILRDQITPDELRRAEVLKRCPDLGRLLREIG